MQLFLRGCFGAFVRAHILHNGALNLFLVVHRRRLKLEQTASAIITQHLPRSVHDRHTRPSPPSRAHASLSSLLIGFLSLWAVFVRFLLVLPLLTSSVCELEPDLSHVFGWFHRASRRHFSWSRYRVLSTKLTRQKAGCTLRSSQLSFARCLRLPWSTRSA
jgi:hypothetical protein